MANRVNFAGIQSMMFADVDPSGAFPSTGLEPLSGIKEGTMTFNVNEPATTSIYIEESNTPFATAVGNQEVDFTLELLGVQTATVAEVFGANYTAATASDPERITFPPALASVFRAVQFTSRNSDGENIVVQLPRVQFITSTAATITKSDVVSFQISGRVQIPINTSGVAQNWMIWEVGDATS